jgi:hypothetical protein
MASAPDDGPASDPDRLNPHEDDNLRGVWRQGWRAYVQGTPLPEAETFDDPTEMTAWIDGYVCARASGDT